MNKTLLILAIVLLLLPLEASAYKGNRGKQGPQDGFRQAVKSRAQTHRQEQKAESREFRKSLRNSDLSQDQKVAAIKERRQTQYTENAAFHEQIHTERMDRLSDELSKNEQLTDEQKQSIIGRQEKQYEENVAYQDKQYSEGISAIDRIMGDPNLSPEERETQMEEYRAGQRKKNQERRQAQREKNQAFRKSFRPEE